MKRFGDGDDPRRRLLIKALAAGLFLAGSHGRYVHADGIFGSRPAKLPAGRSVYRVSGTVTVNGKAATEDTRIVPGDAVRTGKDSEIVFVVGDCSNILRSDSYAVLGTANDATTSTRPSGIQLLVGKLLSVFAPGHPVRIQTATANIRIRGTGVYLESDAEQTYFCTCYGFSEVVAKDDPESKDTVVSKHHDKPLYILAGNNNPGKSIRPAPFINHTDQELALIETLVGRTPPFMFANDRYTAPRIPDYRR